MNTKNQTPPPPPEGNPRPVWAQLLIGLVMGALVLAALYFLGRRFL